MRTNPSPDPVSLAARLMAMEVISELLASTAAGKLPQKLTEQLREFTGARTVMLIAHTETPGDHEVLHACPIRRASLFSSSELADFCTESTPDELPQRPGDLPANHPLRAPLLRAGVESLLRFPLHAVGELVGLLLFLDLPERERIDEVTQTLTPLLSTIAMSLKNALAHQRIQKQACELESQARALEQRVAERTAELQDANRTLAASRLAALNMMEDAVAAQHSAEQATAALELEIIERKRMETQLLQAQKMEAIGRLAGGIAHDFRNQLTIVKGYGEMLLRLSLIKDGKEDLVGEILKAAHRGAELTGQLLAFSRKDMLQPSIVNMGKVVANLAGPMSRLVGEDIVVSTTGGGPECMVDIAATQFEHAMMNLAANSRDAMPRGGELTIDTACIDVDATRAAALPDAHVGPYVRVTLRDSGMGMDADTKSKLFEPFFTTKERGQGTGLGLPMVYGFVRQSGGFITVDSEPGEGTAFALHFPRIITAVTPESHPDAVPDSRPRADMPRGTETVLVVEDEEPIRWLVAQALRSSGYTVVETGDARQATELAEKADARIDMLISDVVMPGMSGVELATLIRGRQPGIPVLFISGYGSDDLSRRGVDLDRAKLLVKPFQTTTLIGIVRQLLDERQ